MPAAMTIGRSVLVSSTRDTIAWSVGISQPGQAPLNFHPVFSACRRSTNVKRSWPAMRIVHWLSKAATRITGVSRRSANEVDCSPRMP
jgi:hypothetical protein